MFLKHKQTGDIIQILSVEELFEPTKNSVTGVLKSGEDERQSESFDKDLLLFPSGEKLPLCWLDSEYRSKTAPE